MFCQTEITIDSAFSLSVFLLKRHIFYMCGNTCLGRLCESREIKRATRKVGLIAHIFSGAFLHLTNKRPSLCCLNGAWEGCTEKYSPLLRRQTIHFAGALSCANEFTSPSSFQLQGQGQSNCQFQLAGAIDLLARKLSESLLTSLSHCTHTQRLSTKHVYTLQILTGLG